MPSFRGLTGSAGCAALGPPLPRSHRRTDPSAEAPRTTIRNGARRPSRSGILPQRSVRAAPRIWLAGLVGRGRGPFPACWGARSWGCGQVEAGAALTRGVWVPHNKRLQLAGGRLKEEIHLVGD